MKYGIPPVHSSVEASPGSNIYVDNTRRLVRIIDPDGSVLLWKDAVKMEVRPGKLWEVTWTKDEGDEPHIMFLAATGKSQSDINRSMGYEFYAKHVEGQEGRLWPEFLQLMRNEFYNPTGIPLKSGIYEHAFVSFQINFGEDGSTPSIMAVDDTVPPVLDFPFRTRIAVRQQLVIRGSAFPAGEYDTEIMGYNVETGEATHITCSRFAPMVSFNVDSEEMTQLMHEGKIDLLEVVEDRMPNF